MSSDFRSSLDSNHCCSLCVMAIAPTVVKEVAMASMASIALSPPSSYAFSSCALQPSPSFVRASQSGSQPIGQSFTRVTQITSHPSPRFCRVSKLSGSHRNPYFCTGLQTIGSQFDPRFARVLRNGSRPDRRSEALKGFSCRAASSSSSSPPQDCELPAKLQEIVRVFQGVTEPRAKCEALLKYGAKLKPLAEEQKQPENKVEGCVSNVCIVCEVDGTGRVYFEAESDVLLTKGLAGLLVEGLSGVTVEEVLSLTPDFVHKLGLKQSLTPSRSNGFLNMLKLIQKKTLQLCSNSNRMVAAAKATMPITSIDSAATPSKETCHREKDHERGVKFLQLEVQESHISTLATQAPREADPPRRTFM